MTYTSFGFFVFVVICLLVYYCAPKKYQWCVLLVASYVFYAFAGGWGLFAYLLFTTATVYGGALLIARIKDSPKPVRDNKWYYRLSCKWIIILITVSNFGILAFFKWYNTLADFGNSILSILAGSVFKFPVYSLLLPLGISFYTFQAIGYLVDVHRNKVKPERNFARFALFVSFFPQLIQGPISRHSQLADQLYESRKFSSTELKRGLLLAVFGLFKKLVIADRLVSMISEIFGQPEKYNGLYVLIGLVAYAIRVYTDFSGGVDVSRGVAQMLGIHMPQNFARPFFATSLPDYWRRWHMSLNEWWRDYIFYPLVLSKPMAKLGRFTRKYVNNELGKVIGVFVGIFVVLVINAMWHGADLFYIANGSYHSILIISGMALAPIFIKATHLFRINTACHSWKLFQITRTFLLICISHVFINARGVAEGLNSLRSIISDFNPWILNYDSMFLIGLSRWDVRIIFISLFIVLVFDIMHEKGIAIRETLEKQNAVFQWLVLFGGIMAVVLWGSYGFGYDPVNFVYMQW